LPDAGIETFALRGAAVVILRDLAGFLRAADARVSGERGRPSAILSLLRTSTQ